MYYTPSILPVQSPVSLECFGDEVRVGASRDAVDGGVSAHDAGGLPFHHTDLERRVERILHVLGRHPRVEVVPYNAVPGFQVVRRGVLAARRGLQGRRRGALQALDEGHRVLARRRGVLAGGLLAAAPPGVAVDVHVGGPDGQPLRLADVVQRPRLRPDRLRASIMYIVQPGNCILVIDHHGNFHMADNLESRSTGPMLPVHARLVLTATGIAFAVQKLYSPTH